MTKRLTALFPLWAILFSCWAYFSPAVFTPYKAAIIPLLGVVMFGMGMTLTAADFLRIFKTPGLIITGISLQYLLMPLIAWGLGTAFGLPKELLIGMVLVGTSPGGTASNVICYLARANVALSISLTFAATLLSFIVTPVLTKIYIGQVVYVPVLNMLITIFKIIIVPVAGGVVINTLWGKYLSKFKDIFPLISVAAIVLIIAIIVGLNQDNLKTAGMLIMICVVLHNSLGLISGYGLAKALDFDEHNARTIAIEVGMQNSGLAVALAVKYFSAISALPGALFSIWHNLSGSFLARYFSGRSIQTNT